MAQPSHIRELRAVMVAEFALKQRLERIKWEEEVLVPAIEEAKSSIYVTEFDLPSR